MAHMNSHVQPHAYIVLRPSSGLHKVVKATPGSTISLGKYGSVATNLLIGRPFYLTFEVLDKAENEKQAQLRVVSAHELHAETLADNESASESRDEANGNGDDEGFDIVGENGEYVMRNNRLTVDDPARQVLSMEEIEQLKKAGTGSGKDIIAKIMESHSAIEEKTAFSLAKYTLRKTKKYMRRFTLLPLDVSTLAHWMLREKEPARIMELREEVLGLIASWSNVHFRADEPDSAPSGRWLVVDDTGGLIVALLAERMGILHPRAPDEAHQSESEAEVSNSGADDNEPRPNRPSKAAATRSKRRRHAPDAMSAQTNTITLLHPATQPNISLLGYFSYNPTEATSSTQVVASDHPLHTRLKTLTWLQLLHPEADLACIEPEKADEADVATWKAGKRSSYFRKRRRWVNTMRVVEEARAGGFDGLAVASAMDNLSILDHAVPLLRGGAPVVVYHPNVEPLAELADAYSTTRKTAFINLSSRMDHETLDQDFAVDPRLLLAPSLQTVRAREWQALPGRTHPLMTSRGGAESYVFTATRVLPVGGKVEARGRYAKKRKIDDADGQSPQVEAVVNGA